MLRVLALAAALAASGAALAQADVGLVNLVAGEVTFAPLSGKPGKVQPFMRVRDGDRFTLGAGAQLRVVFFDGSRQERWQGPAGFRAGRKQGEPLAGKPAEVAQLPAGVPGRIARVPELVQNAKLGGIQVRGVPPRSAQAPGGKEALREARATYEELRKALPADDLTPELYLYSALADYQLYDEMKPVVAEMLRKQPHSEEVKSLAAWVESRAAR